MKKTKRILQLLLCLAMLVSLMPTTSFSAEVWKPSLKINQNKAVFAGRTWWVIGDGSSGVYPQPNCATLLAADYESDYQKIPFRKGSADSFENSKSFSTVGRGTMYYANNPSGMAAWGEPNEYAGSTLQQKMVQIAKGLPAKDAAYIRPRNLTGSDSIKGPNVNNQKLWPLSLEEYNTIKTEAVCLYGGIFDHFWLRTPGYGEGERARQCTGRYMVPEAADMFYNIEVDWDIGARPALNVDLSSLLLISNTDDATGKPSVSVGNGFAETEKPDDLVKFTMKHTDQNLNVYATWGQSRQTAKTLTFGYANATGGANQYISCILTTRYGDMRYYARLVDSSNASSGFLSIPLDGVRDNEYTLSIFSEQINDSRSMDFCSEPVTMRVVVSNGVGIVSSYQGDMHYHMWNPDAWAYDDSHHWRECLAPNCPLPDNSQKDEYAMHVYDQQAKEDAYKASDATCTEAKKYYYSCKCGVKGTEVFNDGEPLGHTWESWQRDGADQHTRTCSVCQTSESGACSGGTATCTNQAVCTKCGETYGDLDPNNHTGIVTWIQTATAHHSVYNCCNATVTAEKAHKWEKDVCLECGYPCQHTGGTATCSQMAVCEICGSQYGVLDPDRHQAADTWTKEKDKHYHKCVYGCDTHLDEADCSGGTATCSKNAVCTVCGNTYGKLRAHHLEHRKEITATYTKAGNIEYWHCTDCMKNFSDEAGSQEVADTVLPVLEHTHTYGEWTITQAPASDKTGIKTKSCTLCGHTITEVVPAVGDSTDTPKQSVNSSEQPAKLSKQKADTSKESANPATLKHSGAGPSRTDSASKTTSNHTKSPQTGDDYELSLWFDMFLLSGTTLLCMVMVYRRRNSNGMKGNGET